MRPFPMWQGCQREHLVGIEVIEVEPAGLRGLGQHAERLVDVGRVRQGLQSGIVFLPDPARGHGVPGWRARLSGEARDG